MKQELEIRKQLKNLLLVRQAHMSLEDAVVNFPEKHVNTKPLNLAYSFWHLLEHLRIAQLDILEYIRNPQYQAPEFPAGYWPDCEAVADPAGWRRTIQQCQDDRQALIEIIEDPEMELTTPIPHGWDGHNIMREILVVADHNAYHIGEFGILRGIMGLW